MTKILGNHTFQMGAYAAFAQKNEDNSPDVQGILTFDASSAVSSGNALADLLMGNVASYSSRANQPSTITATRSLSRTSRMIGA